MTPETLVRNAVCAELKRRGIFFWINDSVGIYNAARGTFMRSNNPFRIKGTADILGILPGGRFLAIELKSKRGTLSPDQKAFLDRINQDGGLAFMARSPDDVITQLETIK
jgi:hypothetical protein